MNTNDLTEVRYLLSYEENELLGLYSTYAKAELASKAFTTIPMASGVKRNYLLFTIRAYAVDDVATLPNEEEFTPSFCFDIQNVGAPWYKQAWSETRFEYYRSDESPPRYKLELDNKRINRSGSIKFDSLAWTVRVSGIDVWNEEEAKTKAEIIWDGFLLLYGYQKAIRSFTVNELDMALEARDQLNLALHQQNENALTDALSSLQSNAPS